MAKAGRPSSFKEDFIRQAKALCMLGHTDVEIADVFGVAVSTLYLWKTKHPLFSEALKAGKAAADDRVERSLYHRAVGYTYDAEKIFQFQGKIVRAKTREHVPPDTTSCIFWLKNRKPEEWRDRVITEHTGKGGGPIATINLSKATDEQLASLEAIFGPLASADADDAADPGGTAAPPAGE